MPLGLRVLNKVSAIIREEMNAIEGQEVLLTTLQSAELWKKTKRWDDKVVDVWFKTMLHSNVEIGLGNTHEEPLTEIMRHHIASWRDLPRYVYQFQTKFRNELRVKSGLLRTREFIMKDLYSFSRSEKEHEEFYEKSKKAYKTIFDRIGIGEHTILTQASGGIFSEFSHEFQTISPVGEDTIFYCKGKGCSFAENKEIAKVKKGDICRTCAAVGHDERIEETRAIEVGNIFSLGTRFAKALGLEFTDEKGQKHPVVMGSYGIGPARVLATAVELFHDSKGIIWPASIAPFQVHLIALPGGKKEAELLYNLLQKKGSEILFDDRDETAGEKLADADLFGIPIRLVVSKKTVAKNAGEIKERAKENVELVDIKEIAKRV